MLTSSSGIIDTIDFFKTTITPDTKLKSSLLHEPSHKNESETTLEENNLNKVDLLKKESHLSESGEIVNPMTLSIRPEVFQSTPTNQENLLREYDDYNTTNYIAIDFNQKNQEDFGENYLDNIPDYYGEKSEYINSKIYKKYGLEKSPFLSTESRYFNKDNDESTVININVPSNEIEKNEEVYENMPPKNKSKSYIALGAIALFGGFIYLTSDK